MIWPATFFLYIYRLVGFMIKSDLTRNFLLHRSEADGHKLSHIWRQVYWLRGRCIWTKYLSLHDLFQDAKHTRLSLLSFGTFWYAPCFHFHEASWQSSLSRVMPSPNLFPMDRDRARAFLHWAPYLFHTQEVSKLTFWSSLVISWQGHLWSGLAPAWRDHSGMKLR